MALMSNIPDKSVLQKVNQRLSRLGGSQGKVVASVNRGDVTLSGTIQYEMQRASIVKVATSVPGVRRVIDQLKMKPKERLVHPAPRPVSQPVVPSRTASSIQPSEFKLDPTRAPPVDEVAPLAKPTAAP
jgi:hypothetical protein